MLEHPGPIFEFDDERLLVRREAPGAPDFAIDTPIPAVEAYRECLLASGTDGCAHLEKQRVPETGRMGPAESHWIRLLNPDTAHLRITLFPRGRYREGAFELHMTGRGRVYMFEEASGWHVTNNRSTGIAVAKDPPPEPCELNPKVPCATEARQTASAARESVYQSIRCSSEDALGGRLTHEDRLVAAEPERPGPERHDLRAAENRAHDPPPSVLQTQQVPDLMCYDGADQIVGDEAREHRIRLILFTARKATRARQGMETSTLPGVCSAVNARPQF